MYPQDVITSLEHSVHYQVTEVMIFFICHVFLAIRVIHKKQTGLPPAPFLINGDETAISMD
jgi:hypothetical protein